MALYDSMFNQYGIQTAQVLVTKRDFQSAATVENLRTTLNALLDMRIVPIINENDAVSAPPSDSADIEGIISVTDNDSLAATVAVHMKSDFLVLLTDVDGIFSAPPNKGGHLLDYYTPSTEQVIFGEGSAVGRGGMESKVDAAGWAFRKGVAVVVANGFEDKCISKVMNGETIGTFFTSELPEAVSILPQQLRAGVLPCEPLCISVRRDSLCFQETPFLCLLSVWCPCPLPRKTIARPFFIFVGTTGPWCCSRHGVLGCVLIFCLRSVLPVQDTTEEQAKACREASRKLQQLAPAERAEIIETLVHLACCLLRLCCVASFGRPTCYMRGPPFNDCVPSSVSPGL